MSDTKWTPELRIDTARKLAAALMSESRGIIMSRRAYELAELIFYVLTMPPSILDANRDKYAEWQ